MTYNYEVKKDRQQSERTNDVEAIVKWVLNVINIEHIEIIMFNFFCFCRFVYLPKIKRSKKKLRSAKTLSNNLFKCAFISIFHRKFTSFKNCKGKPMFQFNESSVMNPNQIRQWDLIAHIYWPLNFFFIIIQKRKTF